MDKEKDCIMPNNPTGKWSGNLNPPQIGDRVTVNFNGFGN